MWAPLEKLIIIIERLKLLLQDPEWTTLARMFIICVHSRVFTLETWIRVALMDWEMFAKRSADRIWIVQKYLQRFGLKNQLFSLKDFTFNPNY